jgi:radical SAM protein with 4Fe4S-binding SPASM domain
MEKINNYLRLKGGNPFGSQAKMLHHLDRLEEYRTTGDSRPILCEVNLTNQCRLKCEWCISSNFEGPATLEPGPALRFFREFHALGGQAVTFSGGGEPTEHYAFRVLAQGAKTTGLALGLMTNGAFSETLVSDIGKGFDWLRVSLDTVDPDEYTRWKGVPLVGNVLRNLKELKRYPVKVGVNVNVTARHTREGVAQLIAEVSDKADYLQFRPVLPRYYLGEEPETNTDVWDWLKEVTAPVPINLSSDKLNDIETREFFPFRSCDGHVFNPVLDANGDLVSCMYHPGEPEFVFGNIYQNTLREIWSSGRRQTAMRHIEELDYRESCQICCKLTELNRLLDFIGHPEETPDISFL